VGGSENAARRYFDLHRPALGAWRRLEHRLGHIGTRWHGMLTWCAPGAEQPRFDGELSRRQRWGGPAHRVDARDVAGWSAYPRRLDLAEFRRVADAVGAL
jgi:hypothetical protein